MPLNVALHRLNVNVDRVVSWFHSKNIESGFLMVFLLYLYTKSPM